MAKYTIREANQDDLPGITRLRHTIKDFRSFDDDIYISFWNSQIYSNPHSIRHVFVGVNEKNEIVAHLAMVPFKFLIDGEPIIGGSLCELMVHEDFRKELLFPRLEMKILSGYKDLGMAFSFGLANRGKVKKAHLSLGYSEIGDLAVYAKPYKLAGIARSFIKSKVLNAVLMPGLYIAEKLLQLIRSSGKLDLDAVEISGFDTDIDKFLVEIQKHFPYCTIRNSTILNWRFASSPQVKYHFLATKDNGNITGYAVLRQVAMKGFNALAIVDILFSPDRIDIGKALMKAVHNKAMQLEVDMSACLLNPYDPLCPIIKKCGYFKTPETFALIIHEPKGTSPRFSKDTFAKWHLTWFDHDAL